MIPFTKIPTPSEVVEAISEVYYSGQYVAGEKVHAFEEKWASVCGARYAVGVSSGSAALTLALRAVFTPGSRVLVPLLSFVATLYAVQAAYLEAVWIDVDDRGLMDLDAVRKALRFEQGIAGAVPVHLYGQLVDVDALRGILPDGARIVEDAAQAHGVFEKLSGEAAIFSFYPSKNLGACGEAGAVVTNSEEVARYVRTYSDYGRISGQKHVHSPVAGDNLRMDEIQAAVLLAKLPYLGGWNSSRREMAAEYARSGIGSLAHPPTNWHLYPVATPNPSKVMEGFKSRGIQIGTHYPYTLAEVAHAILTVDEEHTNAYRISRGHVTLPMGPGYSQAEVQEIVGAWYDSQ